MEFKEIEEIGESIGEMWSYLIDSPLYGLKAVRNKEYLKPLKIRKEEKEMKFKVGDRVKHIECGDGNVVFIDESDLNQPYLIEYDKVDVINYIRKNNFCDISRVGSKVGCYYNWSREQFIEKMSPFKAGDIVTLKKDYKLSEIQQYENNYELVEYVYGENYKVRSCDGDSLVVNTKDDWNFVPIECFKLVKPLLDDVEKEYLSNVIKPFRNRIKCIKMQYDLGNKFCIGGYLENDSFVLPSFKRGSMYKNMEINKEYTLEELGL